MNTFAAEKIFFEHAWDSAHPLLAHFPIALLTFAFLFTLLGYTGKTLNRLNISWSKKLNLERFYKHVWVLQLIGTIFIYPTMLFGERDYDTLGSQTLQDIAEDHEEYGEMTTNYYILITVLVGLAILHYRYNNKLVEKGSTLDKLMAAKYGLIEKMPGSNTIMRLHKKMFSNDPLRSFVWLIASVIGFTLLSYTGYLGGELVHEHGILAN